jgi:hypothetical protein
MRLRAPSPGLRSSLRNTSNTIIGRSPEVFILQDIISFRMNTYIIGKASLKTWDFKSLWNEHLRKIDQQLGLE